MENYKLVRKLGCGKYSIVWEAIDKTTNEVVAIKELFQEYNSLTECIILPELQSLWYLNGHPNIVELKHSMFGNNKFFLIFECMDTNLRKVINQYIIEDKVFSEADIRNMMLQILQAVEHIHGVGYLHRDLKLENLLVSKNVVKVADLGAAEELSSGPPYTTCCATSGFYSAPELMLENPNHYGPAVDIWAVGAIMVEFFILQRLFPNALELIEKHHICSILQAQRKHKGIDGKKTIDTCRDHVHSTKIVDSVALLIDNASIEALDLIAAMCSWCPSERPTASEALQHQFFKNDK
ncbi:hypothetical protein KC19_1G078300 [Ceratodon purpureus]|uniref:Protein kinase domain-containing protein n=1 Tax=Ceratodon purpureus TaxID=3225 RepID=A0A8T0J2M5_CERPU|nr:hypothetical protein KC19_1G078300 [Ceratodon purpureus]